MMKKSNEKEMKEIAKELVERLKARWTPRLGKASWERWCNYAQY